MISQEVSHFLAAKDSWFLRGGTYTLLMIVSTLLITGNLVKVPDFTPGELKIQRIIRDSHGSGRRSNKFERKGIRSFILAGNIAIAGNKQNLLRTGQQIRFFVENSGHRYCIWGTIDNLRGDDSNINVTAQIPLNQHLPVALEAILIKNVGKVTKVTVLAGNTALLKIIFSDSISSYKNLVG